MAYLILSFITVLSFVIFGLLVRKKNSNGRYKYNYYFLAIIPILLYSFTYGFRYGWGTDYVVYYGLYKGIYSITGYEPLFRFINQALNYWGFSFVAAFVVYSFILILGIIVFLKKYREIAFLALPLFYFISAYQASNFIRYFTALAFIFISFRYLLESKWIKCFILWGGALLIHSSVALLVPIILLFKYFNPFKNILLTVILFFISQSLDPTFFGQYLYNFVESLSGVDWGGLQYDKYFSQNALEKYFSGANLSTYDETFSLFARIRLAIVSLLIIVYGHSLANKDKYKDFSYFYKLSVFGILLLTPVTGNELLYRIAIFFYYFIFIVMAYIFYDLRDKYKMNKSLGPLFLILILFYIYDFVYVPVKAVMVWNPKYVWDYIL